jgi:hypothetical protein
MPSITPLNASTPYVRGLIAINIPIHFGRFVMGNIAPLKKNMGRTRKFIIT